MDRIERSLGLIPLEVDVMRAQKLFDTRLLVPFFASRVVADNLDELALVINLPHVNQFPLGAILEEIQVRVLVEGLWHLACL